MTRNPTTEPELNNPPLHLLKRALFGDSLEAKNTRRGRLLLESRKIRALRAWTKDGCYAWWRLTDDLKNIQKEMHKELFVQNKQVAIGKFAVPPKAKQPCGQLD